MNIENYKPDFLLEAVYQLDAKSLKKHQIKSVLVDLDNTLIAWDNPEGSAELRAWLKEMKEEGIKVIVVSNNTHKRVGHAVRNFDVPFVSRSMKPFTRGIKKALKILNERPENAVMVGDQLMTDIRAAHRAGLRSILVKQLVESDSWQTKFNRARERRVLKKIVDQDGPLEWKNRI
ncbi:YqeG family HAD IIIA-type phosphatase [Streptococcaceae bacterium ESL0687]|nr:YqeG family HAD IIIA-type phosphatase [Streptococcaceae bacterium ESL0687]